MKSGQSSPAADLSLAIKENVATTHELLDEMRALRTQVRSAMDHVREGLILLHRELEHRPDNRLQNVTTIAQAKASACAYRFAKKKAALEAVSKRDDNARTQS